MEIILDILALIGLLTVCVIINLIYFIIRDKIKDRRLRKQYEKQRRNQPCPYGVTMQYWLDEIKKLEEKEKSGSD